MTPCQEGLFTKLCRLLANPRSVVVHEAGERKKDSFRRTFCLSAYRIVDNNLRDLLQHCCDVDQPVGKAARHIVHNYGRGGLPFVQEMIAEAMLGLMGDLLSESTEISPETEIQVMRCTRHLQYVVRVLSKPQRQKWVSLLVRVLRSQTANHSEIFIEDLKLLWRSDDDPRRNYSEAERELRSLRKSVSRNLRMDLSDLLYC